MRRVITVSDAIRVIGCQGVRREGKWTTVHSGIDPEKVRERKAPDRLKKELGIPSELPIIGNVAALADHKDHITFLRTAKLFLDRGERGCFVIIGEGPERESVEEELQRLGLEDHVRLLGFRNDVPELLSGMDVFLMSSKTEGLGTSILDAMAASVPVVCTDAGGIPELVQNGKNGILCHVEDPQCLSEGLSKLLHDRDLRERFVQNGAATAQEHSFHKMAISVHRIYSSVLEELKG